MEGAVKALVDAFQTKFKESVKVQEDHTQRMAKENQLLRAKLTTLIKKARPSIASSESNLEYQVVLREIVFGLEIWTS